MLEIIVEPVVVIPDILSKKASVTDSLSSEKMNGIDPKIAILIHESAVSKKPVECLLFSDDLYLIKKIVYQI